MRRVSWCRVVGILAVIQETVEALKDVSVTATSTTDAGNTVVNEAAVLADIEASQVTAAPSSHWPWMWGVFIAILVVVCIFVALVVYLVGAGIFNADGASKVSECERPQRSQYETAVDHKTVSRSPKKHFRINISYHSPKTAKPDTIANGPLSPCMEHSCDAGSLDEDEEDDNDGKEEMQGQVHENTAVDTKTCTTEHHYHKRHRSSVLVSPCNEGSETTTCDTKIIHHSCDLEPSAVMEAITESKHSGNVTPTGSDNEYDHEASIVRYVITCTPKR